MREVDRRSKHSRRVFLKGAATAVPVVAVATSVATSIEDAWADVVMSNGGRKPSSPRSKPSCVISKLWHVCSKT